MPHHRPTNTALRLLQSQPQQYICHTCRAQLGASRGLHGSRALAADASTSSGKPWSFARLRDDLFGKKDSAATSKSQTSKEPAIIRETPVTVRTKDGKEYVYAQLAIPDQEEGYKRAVNWDGLETVAREEVVGSEEWIKAREGERGVYQGFMSSDRVELSSEQWDCLLHTVVVEALTLAREERGFKSMFAPHSSTAAQSVNIIPGRTAAETQLRVELGEETPSVLEELNPTIPEGEMVMEACQAIETGEIQPQPHRSSSWQRMPLDDARLKFVIVKRVMQLTGHRLSDNAISNANTISDLLRALKTREPPKKLAHSSELQSANTALPNVVVYDRRRTPIHKDMEVGRWKLIEQELRDRGLPVTGTSWPGAKAVVALIDKPSMRKQASPK